jgi:hypothetical protein
MVSTALAALLFPYRDLLRQDWGWEGVGSASTRRGDWMGATVQSIKCSGRYMWIPGPITTVHCEHNRPKATAAAKINFIVWRWFTESTSGGMVVHGNHPIRVRRLRSTHG